MATPLTAQSAANPVEVFVFADLDQTIAWLDAESWWGEEERDQQLTVPKALLTGVGTRWQETARNIPVATAERAWLSDLAGLLKIRGADTASAQAQAAYESGYVRRDLPRLAMHCLANGP